MKSKRINGLDLARALAIIGMIIVNFKMVLGSEGEGISLTIADFLSGKAAALFVTLAGVGIALMTKKGVDDRDSAILKNDRWKLIKRSILLFVIGLSYIVIWPADILHFYGVYMLLVLLLISASQMKILLIATGIIFLYPLLMILFPYDIGWDFSTLEYQGFWSVVGFVRNLFYNGFHPVFPWVSFMLVGLWFGRHDLYDHNLVKRLMIKSFTGFLVISLVSKSLLYYVQVFHYQDSHDLYYIFGLSPMPPLPIYMLANSFLSIGFISGCILLSSKYNTSRTLTYLINTGKLSLSLYVAHVVFGMGLAYVYNESAVGQYHINATMLYALLFSIFSIVISNVWLNFFNRGPLEWLFNKILG